MQDLLAPSLDPRLWWHIWTGRGYDSWEERGDLGLPLFLRPFSKSSCVTGMWVRDSSCIRTLPGVRRTLGLEALNLLFHVWA